MKWTDNFLHFTSCKLSHIKTIDRFVGILKFAINCVLHEKMLFGATKNMSHTVLYRIDKQALFPADTFSSVFYVLYHHMFILNTIWANDFSPTSRFDLSLCFQ